MKGVMKSMFGSFGCCDNFKERDRHHHEKEDFKGRFNRNFDRRFSICNVLENVAIGTNISLLTLKDNGTFNNVIFQGFCNGVALFSAGEDGFEDDFTGLLRVCLDDIVAIAI
ncbi:conserved hypothetical protein [Bacillus cytotoxicus NVH 391-98]|uniref:DUF3915 domain-containing protein n=2 Tax=Bacillus cytotoxicus TaxID=580165 RepID=A7GS71_BACCN|nr:conserved hypothetical protein [Bacillus cytotoxicus NVH 391-98]